MRDQMTMTEANSNFFENDQGSRWPFACLVVAWTACILFAGCQGAEDDERPANPPDQNQLDPDLASSVSDAENSDPPRQASTESQKSTRAVGNDVVSGSEDTGASSDPLTRSEQQDNGTFNIKPSVDQLRESALQALGQGQDDLAFQLVRQAIQVEPDNPQVVFLLAMVLGDRHRYAEAIQLLQDLSSREPTTRLPALGQTAEWMVESGRYDEAEQQFRNILKEVPDALMVHHRLGQLLLQTGRRTGAALHFDYLSQFGELDHEELRALLIRSKAFPGDNGVTRFDPLNNLAMCRQEVADGKATEVMKLIVAAGEGSSDAEKALLNRLRAENGKFESVQEWIENLDMTNAGPDGWYARGYLALNRASHAEAIACFCQVLLLDQTDVNAYQMLSRALEQQGEMELAKAVAIRAALVDETRKIGAELVGEKAKDRELIAKLAQSLMKLNRPMEALGWRTIGLVHAVEAAAITETQAQVTFEEIGRQRNQLVNSGRHRLDPAFVLCGLGPNVLDPVVEKTAE